MSVHRKLMEARVQLQNTDLKKSGLNKFAGYSYFELGDFIPTVQKIFLDLKLCGVVSYSVEYATLTITDTEDGTVILVTSPMAEANLKGAHPIQNLGAVLSYQRRYLWMACMEIVEHDAIDSSDASEKKVVSRNEVRPVAKTEDPWDMKLSLTPLTSTQEWLETIEQSVDLFIKKTTSQDEVKQIFLRNKQLFEAVKKQDMDFFKNLTAKLSAALKQFPETE